MLLSCKLMVVRRDMVLIVVFLILIMVFMFFNDNPNYLKFARLLSIYSPVFLFSYGYFKNIKNLESSIFIALCGCLVSLFVSIVFHEIDFYLVEPPQKLWLDGVAVNRAGGIGGNTGMYSSIIAISLLLSVYLYSIGKIKVTFLLISISLCLYSIAIVSSRVGLLSSLIGIVLYLIISRAIGLKLIFYSFFLFLMLTPLVGYLFSSSDYFSKSIGRFDYSGSDLNSFSSGRVDNWLNIIDVIMKNPLLGVGYKNGTDYVGTFVDNSFLLVLVEEGVFGFLVFLSIFSIWIRNLLLVNTDKYYKEKALGLSLILVFIILNIFSDAYTFWLTTPILYAVVSMILTFLVRDKYENSSYNK